MKTSFFFAIVSLLAMVATALSQDLATLEIPELGLAMNHPKDWQVSTVNKSKDVKALIPIEGSSQKAVLEIYAISFNSERDVWQLGQKAISSQMKREVMRQWEEELLGVPMLLTKVNFVDKEGPQIMLTGMVYSRTNKKLMFRLAASPDDFDKAEFAWRETMNSFRTSRPWTPEDPTQKPDPKAPQRNELPPPVVVKPNSLDSEVKTMKPAVGLASTVAGRKVEFRFPGEWAGKIEENGSITLTHPEVTGSVKFVLASALDSDPPQKALLAASSKTLGDFQKVSKRDETAPTRNRAGAMVASVWRTGIGAKGDLFSCDAVGANGDFYYLAAFRSVSTSKIGAERKLVEALLNSSTILVLP